MTLTFDLCVLFWVTMAQLDLTWSFERYSTAYMQDSCTCTAIQHLKCEPFTLDPQPLGAGNVALSRTPMFFKEFYCEFTIQAPSKNHRVMLTINHINVPKTKGCISGMLKIFDGPLGEKPAQLSGLCGAEEPKFAFRSNTNRVTLAYHQALSILQHEKSFNLTFTYFTIKNKASKSSCNGSRQFPCVNGQCISRVLECDGWNNCGDGTDESIDYHVCGKLLTSSDPMVGLAVGVTVASLLVIVMATLIAYGIQRRKGPFFNDGSPASTIQTSDVNGNLHGSTRSQCAPASDGQRCHSPDVVPTQNSRELHYCPNTATDVGSSPLITIHNNPLEEVESVSKPIIRREFADDTQSVASSGEYAMGLHRDPAPPSYHSLFPDM